MENIGNSDDEGDKEVNALRMEIKQNTEHINSINERLVKLGFAISKLKK